jgi:hypothetical protein
MKKAEVIVAALSVIALLFNIFLIPGGGILTAITLSLLASLYFYFGFALFNGIKLRYIFKKESYKSSNSLRLIGAAITGASLSMIIIGILFKVMLWPSADININTGLWGVLVIAIFSMVKYQKSRSEYYARILICIAVIGGVGLLIMLTTTNRWIEFKYRNHPALATALKQAISDPNNTALWGKVREERQKIDNEH